MFITFVPTNNIFIKSELIIEQMKKIAIPVEDGQLSAHFGHAPYFYIFETNEQEIVSENLETPPPHEPGSIPAWLADLKVTDVITGGIGQRAIDLFLSNNINTYVGAPVKSAREIITDFLAGTLVTNVNMCDNHDHNHGDGEHHHGHDGHHHHHN